MFIIGLLDGYVFQPNTPNLFERLRDYKLHINKIETTKKEVRGCVAQHKNTLGGMLACSHSVCDLGCYRKHAKLQLKVDTCLSEFQELKSEIFN